jgi:hypothetical protein
MAVRLVFIHGVANRKENNEHSFAANQARMEALFKKSFGADTVVSFPYWGDLGGRLRWNGQSIPKSNLQAFGTGTTDQNLIIDTSGGTKPPLLNIARQSGQTALVDLIAIGLADLDLLTPTEYANTSAELFEFAQTRWDWLPAVKDDNDLSLQFQIQFDIWKEQKAAGPQSFGIIDTVAQGFKKVGGLVVNAASEDLLLRFKPFLAEGAAKFFGDVFVYLDSGRDAIRQRVADGVGAAWGGRATGDKLIIVCHSFGGPIFTDMLTDPASGLPNDLKVDALVTVGSQVGLFMEMDLYQKRIADYGLLQGGKVPRPAQVRNWINVLDLADPLAFALSPIFEGVVDAQFNTETSLLNAHSTYFVRPSFYERLKKRIEMLGI